MNVYENSAFQLKRLKDNVFVVVDGDGDEFETKDKQLAC